MGKIWKVKCRLNNKYYAMKEMAKTQILDKNMRNNIMLEKRMLCNMKSKFIVNIKCAFHDFLNVYLILDLMQGGSLRYHMNHFQGHFPEKMIKFIILNISFCLAIIHFNDIIHQDLQPDNFLFDNEGYLHLTNFNYAIYKGEENRKMDYMNNLEYNLEHYLKKKEIIGNIEYVAPEYITGTERYVNFPLNFYSFGVICYELMFLKKPFNGKTREILQKEMMEEKINFECDFDYSENLINFVKKLLEIYPNKRLGTFNGIKEIKICEYLHDFDWKKFFDRKYESPFINIITEYKNNVNQHKMDDMELFDFGNNYNNYNLEVPNKKVGLKLIELNQNSIDLFKGYDYIYLERDPNEDNDEFQPEKSKKENIENIIKIRRYSHSSCSASSCSCSCSICNPSESNSENSSDVDDYYYFRNKNKKKKKKHNKIKKVYLPIIEKKKKVIIPEIYPNMALDAYKYQINKYRHLIKNLDYKAKEKYKEKENNYESSINSRKYENKKINSTRYKYPPQPMPFIFHNYYYNPYKPLKPSYSMTDLYKNFKNNILRMPNIYPYNNNFNEIFFPDFEREYSSASSTGIYDTHINKKIKEKKEEKKIKKEKSKHKKMKKKETKKDKKNKKKKKEKSESDNNDKSDTNKKSSSENEDEEEEDDSSSEKTSKRKKLSTIKESTGEYDKTSS